MSQQDTRRTLNDPHANPADIADERERGIEERRSEKLTGGRNDSQGHTPQLKRSESDKP
ncbi:hypothetical protein [Pseudomonas sp. RIT-PI-AD]|uniref:hypothetical protein n=1 Tax=Pseudomonas sp. RIT-PI-AD TaxID=3035294 RepID=UPI0021D927AF|nr:hypothetical protein [Pseudomonas sp. RIT-PI-AD]